jgi:hypothetical protein
MFEQQMNKDELDVRKEFNITKGLSKTYAPFPEHLFPAVETRSVVRAMRCLMLGWLAQ